jgi:hypothetical protein
MIFHGLRSPAVLAKKPIIGLTMFLFGSLTFGVLDYLLKTNEAFLQWDMEIAKMFRAAQINAPWSLMENILFGCFLGKELVVLVGTILAIYFLYQHFWQELAMILIGLGGVARPGIFLVAILTDRDLWIIWMFSYCPVHLSPVRLHLWLFFALDY